MQTPLKPSPYQEAIYAWVTSGRGNAVIEATAGSGKTTTLVQAASLLPGQDVLFLAFNKNIVEELTSRLPKDIRVCTLNSLGHSCIQKEIKKKKIVPDSHKYEDIVFNLLKEQGLVAKGTWFTDLKGALVSMIHFCQSSLLDPTAENIELLADRFNVDTEHKDVHVSTFYAIVKESLRMGEAAAKSGDISYSDQIWLPYKWNLYAKPAKFLLIDESQDLTPGQLRLALSALHKDGRVCAVGDKNQAIYAWNGAASTSLDDIKKATNAVTLPLSISYRCPIEIVKRAQTIVPHIQHAPGAALGSVTEIEEDSLEQYLKPQDMVLCRINAPLISLCIKLIGKGIACRVRGRDIGKSLLSIAKKVLEKGAWEDFPALLASYRATETAKILRKKHPEDHLQSLTDRLDGLSACFEGLGSKTFEQFKESVDGLFSDTKSTIYLSSVHKAKGLEAENVFILKPKMLPMKRKNMEDWQIQEEKNLHYVAITRSKNNLYYVKEPVKTEKGI